MYGLTGRFAMRKLLLSACLVFAKLHPNKPQDFWNNALWTDRAKVEMFDISTLVESTT